MYGTPVKPVMDRTNLTELARGARKYGPEWASLTNIFGFGALSRPLNESRTPDIDPQTAPDWFESISGVLDPFRGL